MARRMSASQLKSKFRQIQNKQQQAINKYNQAVRNYNQNRNQAISKFNSSIDNYNNAVRNHNNKVRNNRTRIKNELAKLQSSTSSSTRHITYTTSVQSLHQSYEELKRTSNVTYSQDSFHNQILELSEQENANSLETMNILLGDVENSSEDSEEELRMSKILDELQKLSEDLDARWKGAVFSLSSQNPDAARHFCTSAREIFTKIFQIKAPDKDVFELLPDCNKTERGNPTRRSKIQYWFRRKGIANDELEEFIEKDIDNILKLFHVFNEGTHGSTGKYAISQLLAIKKRVEDGILFLARIAT